MTDRELSEENGYRITERLGIMCGENNPTKAQVSLAIKEAKEACDKLRNEQSKP